MKWNRVSPIISGLAIALAVGIVAYAQTQRNSDKAPIYNRASEITVKGTVEAVNQVTGRPGWDGTHLQLKTESETLDVHVGPSWFLTQNKVAFAKGDQVEVIGSKVKFASGEALLAREITKGDRKLTLRNENGLPVWSRRGRS